MSREFNTTGVCISEDHYMVDIEEKLAQIKGLVDKRKYFTINRGRQYGKTTTLMALETYLADEYTVISISFEGLGDASFANEAVFCQEFLDSIFFALKYSNKPVAYQEQWKDATITTFSLLDRHITKLCENEKIVLMIDEVDKASNFRVFVGFLNMLRNKFLARAKGRDFSFHSVILVGVYDIKNIKLKMVSEGTHQLIDNEKEQNSPWNIATTFEVDMSFSVKEIAGMLADYEMDHQTGMDILALAEEIHFYTSGYPVLVSRICWYIDEKIKRWSLESVREAVRRVEKETDNELFKSLSQNLENHEEVRNLLYSILILGDKRSFSNINPTVDLAYRYNYLKEVNGRAKISNKIFEIVMTNYFISKDEQKSELLVTGGLIKEITAGGGFNMPLCLERFATHWHEIYSEKDVKFLEKQCRLIFLTYLKPILNGEGFYFIESALVDDRRLDLVIIYGNQRFVLELKIWKGTLYNEEGVEQLLGYMDKMNEDKGYLLTFDFRKKPDRIDLNWREESGKKVFEVRI